MPRYVALLRGIAPSGHNMSNGTLRDLFTRLGLLDVASVLSSGNILFRSADTDVASLERRIDDALAAELGLRSRAIIRSHEQLRSLLDSDPFPGLTHGRATYLTATFLKDGGPFPDSVPAQPDPRAQIVGVDRQSRAVLAITDNSDPGRASALMTWLETTYGKAITTRSWLTVQRIVRRLEA